MKISNTFSVNDTSFTEWFNIVLRYKNRQLFPYPLQAKGFQNVMQNIKSLTGKTEMNLAEFCGHFAIIYNETGGRFEALRELGSERYMFEPNQRGKMSYNQEKLGNRLAGNLMKEKGLISDVKDVEAWNSQVFPENISKEFRNVTRNCDFFKYRGGGFNQLTWRNNYKNCLQPLVNEDIDDLTDAQITALFENPQIACATYYNYFSQNGKAKKAISALAKGNFRPYGMLVSGNWVRYVNYYYLPRCQALFAELKTAEGQSILPKYEIDNTNLTSQNIKKIQFLILEYGSPETQKLIMENGGMDGIWGNATQQAFETLEMDLPLLFLYALKHKNIDPKELDNIEVQWTQTKIVNSKVKKGRDLILNSGGVDGILGRNTMRAIELFIQYRLIKQ